MIIYVSLKMNSLGTYEFENVYSNLDKALFIGVHYTWTCDTDQWGKWNGCYQDGSGRRIIVKREVIN